MTRARTAPDDRKRPDETHDRLTELRRSVNWLWVIVGLNSAAILIHGLH